MAKVVAIASSSKLVADINEQHKLFNSCTEKAIDHAIRCGLLLLQAKETVKHGEWGNWLKANIKFSERQAQNYMRVASRLPNEKRNAVADLSLRKAIDHLAKPATKPRVTVTRKAPKIVDWGEDDEEEDPDNDDEQTIWRRGLVNRSHQAYNHALFEDWSMFEVDEELVKEVTQAADAWNQLAAYIKELHTGLSANDRPQAGKGGE
jgi:hypothetical protein